MKRMHTKRSLSAGLMSGQDKVTVTLRLVFACNHFVTKSRRPSCDQRKKKNMQEKQWSAIEGESRVSVTVGGIIVRVGMGVRMSGN